MACFASYESIICHISGCRHGGVQQHHVALGHLDTDAHPTALTDVEQVDDDLEALRRQRLVSKAFEDEAHLVFLVPDQDDDRDGGLGHVVARFGGDLFGKNRPLLLGGMGIYKHAITAGLVGRLDHQLIQVSQHISPVLVFPALVFAGSGLARGGRRGS